MNILSRSTCNRDTVIYVWIFRFDNIVKEFNNMVYLIWQENIVELQNSIITLLITGIWFPALVFIPAL
jgi:hypothetical protein